MNDTLSMLSSLAMTERKKRSDRRSCTPVLFDSEAGATDFSDGSLVWETLEYISNMITQRIFDTIVSQMQAIGVVHRPSTPTLQKFSAMKNRNISDSAESKSDTDHLNAHEVKLLSSNRRKIETYHDHITFERCEVIDMQRQLAFTKSHLSLLCVREQNVKLLEAILTEQGTMRSLHLLQSAFQAYKLTLEPPPDFCCEIVEHAGKKCECYKDFDDYADFECITECLDMTLDAFSDNDAKHLPAIASVSVLYLKLTPKFDLEAVEDAKQAFVEGKDFLLSIWDKFVGEHAPKMAPVELFHLLFLLESLNTLEANKGFHNCIAVVTKHIRKLKMDVYSLAEESVSVVAQNTPSTKEIVTVDSKP